MIIYNVEGKGFSSFTSTYISKSCNLPVPKINMTEDWIDSLSLNYIECAKLMMIAGNPFRQRSSGEYETASLHTPHRLVALIPNRIFERANGKFYKISWIPLMYHVTMQSTIFNWANIVANGLSSCIGAALRGLLERKSEFYMGSYLIDCILCHYPIL